MLPFHALFVVASILGQPGNLPPFIKNHSRTLTFFYEKPDPNLGPTLLKAFLDPNNIDDPWYQNKAHVTAIIASQFAEIARDQPKVIRAYEDLFPTASDSGRSFLVKVLYQCGDETTAQKTQQWLEKPEFQDNRKALETLGKSLSEADKTKPAKARIVDRPAKTPDDLDLLWANFFIHGDYPAVSRILDVLDLPDNRENMLMRRVARWSLTSNLKQHKRLVKIVMEHTEERGPGSKKVINEIIISPPQGNKN